MPEKEIYKLTGTTRSPVDVDVQPGTVYCAGLNAGIAVQPPRYAFDWRDYTCCFQIVPGGSGAQGTGGCVWGCRVNTKNALNDPEDDGTPDPPDDPGTGLYGCYQPFRCNNYYLWAGEFFANTDDATYYGLGPSEGPYTPDDIVFLPIAPHSPTLSDACSEQIDRGDERICYDHEGTEITCVDLPLTLGTVPDNWWWDLSPCFWPDELAGENYNLGHDAYPGDIETSWKRALHWGCCVRLLRLWWVGDPPHNSNITIYATWIAPCGCPDGLVEDKIDPEIVGNLAATPGGSAWVGIKSLASGSGYRLTEAETPGVGNRINGYTSPLMLHEPDFSKTTLDRDGDGILEPFDYGPMVNEVEAPGCFVEGSGNTCPPHTTSDGETPVGCIGESVSPDCGDDPAAGWDGWYFAEDDPFLAGGPFCQSFGTTPKNAQSVQLSRGPFGQLYTGFSAFRRFDDQSPQVVSQTHTVAGGVVPSAMDYKCRKSGVIDWFIAAANAVYHVYSRDGGQTFIPTAGGDQSISFQRVESGGGTSSYTASANQVFGSVGEAIDRLHASYDGNSGAVLLVYHKAISEEWVYRVCRQVSRDDPSWEPSTEYFLALGQSTSGYLQATPDGGHEFFYYDENGIFKATRLREVNPEAESVWEWAEGSLVPEILFDGTAEEQHSGITYHDWKTGIALTVVWEPYVKGPVYQFASALFNGAAKILVHKLDDTFGWVLHNSYTLKDNVGIFNGVIRREIDQTWVIRFSANLTGGSNVYRCRDMDSDGFGTWEPD